ncbi:hypothetical protein EGW08_009606 [Elysia chlorotica]|uniref:Cytochrome b561 domain-containing protein n=1 Tax=Elysia chlorotica TaxID=188477 RepID=A0A3S1BFP6_ELYCH|nr:hypothetical protein EGW08_009606 [Elysia chlorotica]
MTDGTLSCSLRRRLAGYTVAGKTRKNIADPLTLLFARGSGSVENGVVSLSYHGANDRFPSSQPLTASDVLDDSAQDEDYPLIKLHGALMIGAWVFLASIGIVAARYYKPVWKQDMCSLKVWFQIHRTCMVLVFCTCVAGFVVIFLEVEEWVEIEQKPKYLEGHPIMGVVVTGLCVINPLMALIRPHPGTKYRPIFNWAHWFVGTSAHILGVATIFFGFELDKADAPDYLKYILAGYVGWQALVELTLEFLACCCKKRPARSDAYKMSDNGVAGQMEDNDTNQSDGMDSFRKGLFTIHFFVVTAISAVLISLLVVGKKELDS